MNTNLIFLGVAAILISITFVITLARANRDHAKGNDPGVNKSLGSGVKIMAFGLVGVAGIMSIVIGALNSANVPTNTNFPTSAQLGNPNPSPTP